MVFLLVGRKIGNRYVIERLIHTSSRSRVYLAYTDDIVRKPYVIKEMVCSSSEPSRLKAVQFLFEKEVALLVSINHPNISKFFEGFYEGGRFFLVSEYVDGKDLESIVKKGRMGIGKAYDIIMQLSSALLYLNSLDRKVYHDIKPSNVMLMEDGNIKIVDLGISRFFGGEEENYREISGFNSPEVVEGEEYTQRDDVYVLGAILLFLLSGKVPSEGEDLVKSVGREHPHIALFLSKCLCPSSERIGSVLEFIKGLQDAMEGERREEEERRKRHFLLVQKRKKAKFVVFLFFVVLLVLSSIYPFLQRKYEEFLANLCCKNCEKIACALRMYAQDHQGVYPEKLEYLTPKYIKKIPLCPKALRDTYSSSYKAYNMYGFHFYRFSCKGEYHIGAGLKKNYPKCNTAIGVYKSYVSIRDNPMETLLEAYDLDKQGKYEKAFSKFRDLTLINRYTLKRNAGIYKYIVFWNMGRLKEKMGDKKKAFEYFKEAFYLMISSRPYPHPNQVFLLLRDMEDIGYGKRACVFLKVASIKYVLEYLSPDVDYIFSFVDMLGKKGMFKDAQKVLRIYLSKSPYQIRPLVEGRICELRGDYKEAMAKYERFIKKNKGSVVKIALRRVRYLKNKGVKP